MLSVAPSWAPYAVTLLAENFDRVTAINLRGVWTSMKHELRQVREQGSGAIVNCSSLGGLVGQPSRAAYHAAKHGVIGLTKSLNVQQFGLVFGAGSLSLITGAQLNPRLVARWTSARVDDPPA